MNEPEFLIPWNRLIKSCGEPARTKELCLRAFHQTFERLKWLKANEWSMTVDKCLKEYDELKFPTPSVLAKYANVVTERTRDHESPEVKEMKRIDSRISRMPKKDHELLIQLAEDRAGKEISQLTPEIKEYITNYPLLRIALVKILRRQVYQEMER